MFDSLQLPELPSLNDKVTGTFASFTIVAHEVSKIKSVIESISNSQNDAFQKVVMLEYPRKGIWTLALVTGESKNKDGKIKPQLGYSVTNYVKFRDTVKFEDIVNLSRGIRALARSQDLI